MTQEQTATYKLALKEARSAFDNASERLAEINQEQFRLNSEIGRLRRTITALAALCSEEPGFDHLGITESCEEVMNDMPFEVTTAEVVEYLEARGFDISSQKNAAASVHAVLSRLARNEKIEKVEDEENKVKWRGPKYDPDLF